MLGAALVENFKSICWCSGYTKKISKWGPSNPTGLGLLHLVLWSVQMAPLQQSDSPSADVLKAVAVLTHNRALLCTSVLVLSPPPGTGLSFPHSHFHLSESQSSLFILLGLPLNSNSDSTKPYYLRFHCSEVQVNYVFSAVVLKSSTVTWPNLSPSFPEILSPGPGHSLAISR